MADRSIPTPELLRQLLRYEPETGKLFWLPRPVESFHASGQHSAEHSWKLWNSKNAEKQAFTAKTPHGYHIGAVNGRLFIAHRVIWAMLYGKWPDGEIDHLNGSRADNRPENLRDVDSAGNSRNMKKSRRNVSGVNGVSFDRANQKWRACIRVDYRTMCLGRYALLEDARDARLRADADYGFQPDHGTRET